MTLQRKHRMRFWAAFLLAGIVGVLLLVNYFSKPSSPTRLEVFRDAVKRSPDLDKIIMWAREVLRDTNTQNGSFQLKYELQLEMKPLAADQLPKELVPLGKDLFGGLLGPPYAAIYRGLNHTQTIVTVGYGLGRIGAYGLAVGPTNFAMPPGLVERCEKCNDGVFIWELEYRER